ncbi:hypothetical protein VNO80_06334 [Phaseolus coccineus]|uniref:Uncharacterized protein n=1 Tax=Phaseolus coccineus TaxID=3886 RepID=A0AAN9NLL4_PHACN
MLGGTCTKKSSCSPSHGQSSLDIPVWRRHQDMVKIGANGDVSFIRPFVDSYLDQSWLSFLSALLVSLLSMALTRPFPSDGFLCYCVDRSLFSNLCHQRSPILEQGIAKWVRPKPFTNTSTTILSIGFWTHIDISQNRLRYSFSGSPSFCFISKRSTIRGGLTMLAFSTAGLGILHKGVPAPPRILEFASLTPRSHAAQLILFGLIRPTTCPNQAFALLSHDTGVTGPPNRPSYSTRSRPGLFNRPLVQVRHYTRLALLDYLTGQPIRPMSEQARDDTSTLILIN